MRSLGPEAKTGEAVYFGDIKSGREGKRRLKGADPSNLSQENENGNPPEWMGRCFLSSLIRRLSGAIPQDFGGATSRAIE
jgi:hypothetical protein